MAYTEEVTQTVREAFKKLTASTVASLLSRTDIGQLLADIGAGVQVETVSINGSGVGNLSKIPVGFVHACKSDGSATYTQVPDAVTPSSNQWRITNRATGEVTTHSGLQNYDLKFYYLGLTKPSDSAYATKLQELLAGVFKFG